MDLNGKQRRYLRALGHHLQPAVTVGSSGLSPAVEAELERGLTDHELVKVKLGQGCSLERKEVAAQLAAATGAAVAQVLGKTILLYRAAKKPRIALPR